MIQSVDTIIRMINKHMVDARRRWRTYYRPEDDGAYDALCELLEEIEGADNE